MGTLPRSGRCEVTSPAAADAVWAIVSDPTRTGEWSWEDYLPPMHRGLRELVERFDSAVENRKPAVAS